MKKILLLIVAACTATTLPAQNTGTDYRTALGVTYYPAGITLKRFIGTHAALEGIGYLERAGFRLTVLAEFYGSLGNVAGLNWYAGPGAHAAVRNDHWKNNHPGTSNDMTLGADGVVGVDYKMRGLPLNLSLDWQPSVNLTGNNYFEAGRGGLGLRYAF